MKNSPQHRQGMPLGYIIAQTNAKGVYYMPESLFILKNVIVGQKEYLIDPDPPISIVRETPILTTPTPDLSTLGTKLSILLVFTRCHFHLKGLDQL